METSTLLAALAVAIVAAFFLGRSRSVGIAERSGQKGFRALDSLPFYYGMLTALWCAIPACILLMGWLLFDEAIIKSLILAQLPEAMRSGNAGELGLVMNTIQNIALGSTEGININPELQAAAESYSNLQSASRNSLTVVLLSLAIAGATIGWFQIHKDKQARKSVERSFKWILLGCSLIAIFTTVGIVLSVLFESIRFFQQVSIFEFLFGTHWSPQMSIRADQVGSSGAFGAVPLFVGTMLISAIAMVLAVPVGLMAAIYLSEYAGKNFRTVAKPALEVLAGIPTVVYGFFAALTVAPMIRESGSMIGLDPSSESALAAGFVMGVMIIPFVSSLSDDVINAVPQSLRDGSLGLGATKSETIKQVVFPAALPGIVGGVLLAASRAIGETMIVVMAAGLAANLTANPLESVTTVTVQIVTLLVGDQEFDSPKTLAAFALGLMLFVVTLTLNFYALHIVKKYREQYD